MMNLEERKPVPRQRPHASPLPVPFSPCPVPPRPSCCFSLHVHDWLRVSRRRKPRVPPRALHNRLFGHSVLRSRCFWLVGRRKVLESGRASLPGTTISRSRVRAVLPWALGSKRMCDSSHLEEFWRLRGLGSGLDRVCVLVGAADPKRYVPNRSTSLPRTCAKPRTIRREHHAKHPPLLTATEVDSRDSPWGRGRGDNHAERPILDMRSRQNRILYRCTRTWHRRDSNDFVPQDTNTGSSRDYDLERRTVESCLEPIGALNDREFVLDEDT